MNRKTLLFILSLSSILFLSSPAIAFAATLSLDPATSSIPQGNIIDVEIRINTEGENVTSTDVVLFYDNSILSVDEITEGGDAEEAFFPDLFTNVKPDEIYVGASVIDPIDVRNGEGVVATIRFIGASEGASDVTFDCTSGKTSDTNISKSDKNATDIVDCARVVNGRYSVGGGIMPTATPTPTGAVSEPTAIPTPTPTLPTSGSAEETAAVLGVGIGLMLLGIGSRLFIKV